MTANRMIRWYVTTCLVLGACKDNPSKLDETAVHRDGGSATTTSFADELETIRAKLDVPALAAAQWHEGKLIENAAVGVRKLGDPTKVTTSDQWHLGSNTKAMTATLVGIYVDRGKLHWDDTLEKLFPAWKIDPGYAKVTVDQLLRHQGGMPKDDPPDLWKQLWADGDAPDAREKFVRALLSRPPAQKPGTFAYANAGYTTLGLILEKVTGTKWEQLMKTELFDKLGMASCGFGPPGTKDVIDQPRGHDAGGTPIEPGPAADNPPGMGPAGTVHCSLEDYGKFLNLHALGTPAIVSAGTMQHLHTPVDGNYAGGWIVVNGPKGVALLHSGSNTMWYATAVAAPGTHNAFVMASNKKAELENEIGPLVMRSKK